MPNRIPGPEAEYSLADLRTKEVMRDITKKLLGTARQMLRNSRNPLMSPEDLVQDTMVKALADGRSMPDGAKLVPWLKAVMKNTLIDQLREVKAEKRTLKPEEWPFPKDTDPRREDTREDLAQKLEILIGRLPEDQAEVTRAFYIEGESMKEIAGKMNRTEVSVESLLARARRGLVKFAEEEGRTEF